MGAVKPVDTREHALSQRRRGGRWQGLMRSIPPWRLVVVMGQKSSRQCVKTCFGAG
jgi:hypothetical protein